MPKGPNFLAIVIGFAVAILVILFGTWLFLGHQKNMVPLGTKGTPSQTYLRPSDGRIPVSRLVVAA